MQTQAGRTGGTWGHPKLTVFFARWLDMGFSVWCDSVIEDILRGRATPVYTQEPRPAPRALPTPPPVDEHRLACLNEFKAQTHLLQGIYAVTRTQAADKKSPARSH